MILERYFRAYIPEFQKLSLKTNPSLDFTLKGYLKLSQATGETCYEKLCKEHIIWSMGGAIAENPYQLAAWGNYLLWLYDATGEEALLEQIRNVFIQQKKQETKWSLFLYDAITFCLSYETRFNQRKGYGEIIKWVCMIAEETQGRESMLSKCIYLATLVDCYEIMTEEAYDQREVFAVLLREEIERLEPNQSSIVLALLSYVFLKGVSLGILSKTMYQEVGVDLVISLICNYVAYENNRIVIQSDSELISGACMMAWSQYEKMRKGGELE